MKLLIFITLFVLFVLITPAMSHCQMPCGIYDDPAKIKELLQDVKTIEKAMNKIEEETENIETGEENKALNYNQLVRWINQKEEHASHIIKVVSEYFLTQRVKEGEGESLVEHHKILKLAMKAKQTVDQTYVTQLRNSIIDLGVKYYDYHVDEHHHHHHD
eukprot:TRINITY_DN8798_c0_g1_i1.p1 TRINITY_DN8798_c0_g1~~TRINITY_DN8798_c0_g1_i1.p1  ORF type:complete len:160 (+),score=8.48 TRINITY_DN8798_c0_g1_i1:30-509(+)